MPSAMCAQCCFQLPLFKYIDNVSTEMLVQLPATLNHLKMKMKKYTTFCLRIPNSEEGKKLTNRSVGSSFHLSLANELDLFESSTMQIGKRNNSERSCLEPQVQGAMRCPPVFSSDPRLCRKNINSTHHEKHLSLFILQRSALQIEYVQSLRGTQTG